MFSRSLHRALSSPILRSSPQIRGRSFASIRQAQPNVHHQSKILKLTGLRAAIVAVSGGAIYIIDKEYNSSLATRTARALYVLLWVAYEYGSNSNRYRDLNDLHEIASEKLLSMMTTNKGLYIKLGQAIANQGTLFPKAYQDKFPKLYDDAPTDAWEQVDAVLKLNLGSNYEAEYFDWIDKDPIGSASIAQVHKAKLKSNFGGREVALKVQHHYISRQVVVDLWVYNFISRVYEKVFDIPLTMFSKFISQQLQNETNFIHEMENAQKLQHLINDDSELKNMNLKIPKNYPELTTKQVLPAEWIDGVALTKKDELLHQNFNLTLMMQQYIQLFGRQIFRYGFVHSDPHPGNLIARYNERGQQELVLLDHGLYTTLPEKFRLQYGKLWKDLFLLNTSGVQEIALDWGISSPDIFATLVQLRPVKMVPSNSNGKDNRDISDLFKDFIGDKSKFPKELTFIVRTMRMIQNLNQEYGSPVNRINLLTSEAISAISSENNVSWGEYWDIFRIRLTMVFSSLLFRLIRFKQWVSGDASEKNQGLEDYIEMYMENTAKSLGIEWIEI
ncbi:hypothetical protein KGF57_004945 [Candida theae]|uniref:ABC1 atypical kinase-like domain-containing protein n=1 Tax=Candida theae TaxID=1198502 RepID=A0AAD5BAI9_9ASCO|nr:uncharacterized protein KGF57_004945 [Candida theae]KAI5949115.1 hypothetical protein KGF57_004945 [Candida theae]